MSLSPRERAAQKVKTQREQEQLLQDLLGILDSLDHACDHWQQAKQTQAQMVQDQGPFPKPLSPEAALQLPRPMQTWQKQLRAWFGKNLTYLAGLVLGEDLKTETETRATAEAMTEELTSAHSGVGMIRRSLQEVLEQRQVTPIETLGQPFDPSQMYALGRQASHDVPNNTVLQEVVRGYRWQQKILREAQVIVAVASEATSEIETSEAKISEVETSEI